MGHILIQGLGVVKVFYPKTSNHLQTPNLKASGVSCPKCLLPAAVWGEPRDGANRPDFVNPPREFAIQTRSEEAMMLMILGVSREPQRGLVRLQGCISNMCSVLRHALA